MLEVFNRERKRLAYLQNAYNIVERMNLNEVWSLEFSLPDDDEKCAYCAPFHYVRYTGEETPGQMYRIIRTPADASDTGSITFYCEHVIATLVDDVLFGAYTVGNLGTYTADSIGFLLDKQTTPNWILGQCDFTRQFEYGWENENLLAALWSIPNRFTEPYMFTYDTSGYPWRVNLVRIPVDAKPDLYLRTDRNILSESKSNTSAELCTRLYGLGYGEGVNQLTIAQVNGGLPYLQSPPEYIARYGLISRIFIDRRFEDAQSLKERMQVLLAGYQEPKVSVTLSATDLYRLTGEDFDRAEVGRICLLTGDGFKTYIVGVVRNHDAAGVMQITIANKPEDIAGSISDLADRQRIEQVYSQGATQLYAQSIQANATPSIGAVLNFHIPQEMRIVNKVKAKITLDRFRSYSRSTQGGGGSSTTSEAAGEVSRTSQSGGGSSTTSRSGGGGSTTSDSSSLSSTMASSTATRLTSSVAASDGESHRHTLSAGEFAHVHGISHTHRVSYSSHTHEVDIPSHTHDFSVPAHTHRVEIPSHSHSIEQGIFEFGSPQSADIYIGGSLKMHMSTQGEIDLTELILGSDGKIPRGSWLKVEVVPNDLAYVSIDLFVQGFVQSRGGGTY